MAPQQILVAFLETVNIKQAKFSEYDNLSQQWMQIEGTGGGKATGHRFWLASSCPHISLTLERERILANLYEQLVPG